MCHGIHGKPPGQSSGPYHIDLTDKSQIDKWLSIPTKEDLMENGKHWHDQDSKTTSENLENQSKAGKKLEQRQDLNQINCRLRFGSFFLGFDYLDFAPFLVLY